MYGLVGAADHMYIYIYSSVFGFKPPKHRSISRFCCLASLKKKTARPTSEFTRLNRAMSDANPRWEGHGAHHDCCDFITGPWDLLGESGLVMFRNLAPNRFWDVLELKLTSPLGTFAVRYMYDSILFTDLDLLRATAGWRAGRPHQGAFELLIFKSPPALFGWDV